jgi:hypothetical protein
MYICLHIHTYIIQNDEPIESRGERIFCKGFRCESNGAFAQVNSFLKSHGEQGSSENPQKYRFESMAMLKYG